MAEQRPNLLVIMSDEHAAWASEPYGSTTVRTPALKGLAERGVTFENAYCNSPICGPSRASFMTGRLPGRIEAWDNGKPLASDVPTWAHYLTTAGYQTALAGKMHFIGPDQRHGFEVRMGVESADIRIKPGSYDVIGGPPDLTKYFKFGVGTNPRYANDQEVAQQAARFLAGGEGRDPSRPFALCVSFFIPHFPLLADEETFGLYWPDQADLPEIPDGGLQRLHPAWQALREYYGSDKLTPEEIRRARAAYYGLCTQMDRLVAQVLESLHQSGDADNTIVVYVSDHGEHVGGHGLWWKRSFFEESVKVPLIVSWPGRFPAGERRTEVVSLVDLTATLLDWAGAEPIEPLCGRSFARLLTEPGTDWDSTAFSEYYGTDEVFGLPQQPLAGAPRRMIRRHRYKLNCFVGAPPELYDLEADPHEWRDLAADPDYRNVVEDLTGRVTADWDGDRIAQAMEGSIARRRLILAAERVYLGPPRKPPSLG